MVKTRHYNPFEDSLIFDYSNNIDLLDSVLGNIQYAPGLSSMFNTAIDVAIESILLNKSDIEIKKNFQRAAEMGVFTFKMNLAKSKYFRATHNELDQALVECYKTLYLYSEI